MLRRTTLAVLLVGVGLMPMAGRAADNPVSRGGGGHGGRAGGCDRDHHRAQ